MEPVDEPTVTLGGFSAAQGAAVSGLNAAYGQMMGAAESLSQDVSVEGIVDLKASEMQVKASTAAIKAVDESLGAMIDDLA